MKKTCIILLVLLWGFQLSGQLNPYFPTRHEWKQSDISSTGWDSVRLDAALDFALQNEYSGPRDLRLAILKGFEKEPFHKIQGPTRKRGGPAGLIIHKGYVLKKWGDVKRVDMAFSVTKSFLSTVAGLALDAGLIKSVDEPVADYLWDGTFDGAHNSKISWHHLLQQTSDWSGELWGGKDWADRPPSVGGLDDWKYRKLNEPGTVMEYNDVRVNVLAYALTHVWRKPLPVVLKERIMDPIGAASNWRWHGYENAWTEIDGMQMKSVTGGGHSGGGLFISTEDLARFGLLFLRDGKWEGNQLLSKEWITAAMTPSDPNPNYGYMWWLNAAGPRQWEGLSSAIYYAAGFGGNFIVVDQENELIIVTRWLEPSKIGEFVGKVMEALP